MTTPRPHRSRGRGILRWLAYLLLAFFLGSVVWVLAYRFVNPPITFTQMGDLLSGRGLVSRWVPIERIDRDMVRAVIAGEDGRYCEHAGFDRQAIEQAMRRNARGGRVIRGGSTISQQTAKNAFLWQGGGYFRKGLEAWFTFLIEKLWDKRRIMEVYLNVAETGIGTYGVEAAARRYFGQSASALSRNEAARIAAVFPLPKRREAVAPTGFTQRYGNMIAARMAVVARDGLDACVYSAAQMPAEAPERQAPRRRPAPKAAPQPAPDLPGEEFERAGAGPDPQTPEPTGPAPEKEPPPPPEPANGL